MAERSVSKYRIIKHSILICTWLEAAITDFIQMAIRSRHL